MPLSLGSTLRLIISVLLICAAVSVCESTGFAQEAVCQTGEGWQTPTAVPGGPYVGSTDQQIAFYDGGSWSFDGPIVYYHWDFGDGTWATGPYPSHQYAAEGAYTVTLTVCDDLWNCASSQSYATAGAVNVPARIHFDELANNLIVADQYFNQFGVRFYSGNPSFPLHTSQTCGPCSTTSLPNFITTKPNDSGIVNVEFAQPVNNLTFYMIGVDVFFDPFAVIDVYRGGSLYASYAVFGNGTRTVGFTLGSLDNINKVVIRSITDPLGIGFDDFTFNVPSDIKITSGRVNGYLNGTTQNALLGADVALQATPLPGAFAGGTYAWTCAPSQLCSILGGGNSSSVTLRTLDTGTVTATVSYTKNNLTATGSVTINSVLPTLTSFTGQQSADSVNAPGQCGEHDGLASLLWWYDLGCKPSVLGISFLAAARPPSTFLSDPAASGLKFVQAISTFRKRYEMGLRCDTRRTSESDVASGWQLDSDDPFKTEIGAVRYFSQILPFSTDLSIATDDFPGSALTRLVDYQFVHAMYIDDRFEMYVVYFAGGTGPGSPFIQSPLGKLAWNWGGLVVFDPDRHRVRYSNATLGSRTGQATNTMVAMQGNVENNLDVPCPGEGSLSTNRIDSTRELVKYYYLDILRRAPDAGGWNYHTAQISQCVFDPGCLVFMRPQDALGFFFSPEFIQLIGPEDPVMANPPGSPNFNAAEYNPRFVFWCYRIFLMRDPDPGGFSFYMNILNTTGDYRQVIFGFTYSPEYRSRDFQ